MSAILPINVDDLLRGRSIESVRVEFKAGWNPDTTGFQVLKTICAFANDHQNLNGGYVVIGVCEGGQGLRPPRGLSRRQARRRSRGGSGRRCTALRPSYTPILSPEILDGRDVLVVWAPASEDRPHRAPDEPAAGARWKYWIRFGSETVDAEAGGQLESLLEQTERMPWDDHVSAPSADRRPAVKQGARDSLHDVRSTLRDEPDAGTIFRRMRITAPVNDHEVPRNVGLLIFSDDPERWSPGARIEVVHLRHIARARYCPNVSSAARSTRSSGRACVISRDCHKPTSGRNGIAAMSAAGSAIRCRRCVRCWSTPSTIAAIGPSVTELDQGRYVPRSDGGHQLSGPVAGIEPLHLAPDASVPPIPPRNRRVGEFLKQLGLAEAWWTGLPLEYRSMEENGSPVPRFDFDSSRTWSRADSAGTSGVRC